MKAQLSLANFKAIANAQILDWLVSMKVLLNQFSYYPTLWINEKCSHAHNWLLRTKSYILWGYDKWKQLGQSLLLFLLMSILKRICRCKQKIIIIIIWEIEGLNIISTNLHTHPSNISNLKFVISIFHMLNLKSCTFISSYMLTFPLKLNRHQLYCWVPPQIFESS